MVFLMCWCVCQRLLLPFGEILALWTLRTSRTSTRTTIKFEVRWSLQGSRTSLPTAVAAWRAARTQARGLLSARARRVQMIADAPWLLRRSSTTSSATAIPTGRLPPRLPRVPVALLPTAVATCGSPETTPGRSFGLASESQVQQVLAVFHTVGPVCCMWLPAATADESTAKDELISNRVRRVDASYVRACLTTLTRWRSWYESHGSPGGSWMRPAPLDVVRWFQQVGASRPTAARTAFTRFGWWERVLGLPFHTRDAMLSDFRLDWTGHAQVQAKPVPLHAFAFLVRVAAAVSMVARLALLVLTSTLRWRHLRRSTVIFEHPEQEWLIRGRCSMGKKGSSRSPGAV